MSASMAPLVRPITAEPGLSHAAMGSIFGLVYIASAALCGTVLDRFGLRASLFAAAIVIGLSGLLRAGTTSYLGLYVAAFGLGGPFVSVGGPKVIGQWFEGKERRLAMGLYVTGSALGSGELGHLPRAAGAGRGPRRRGHPTAGTAPLFFLLLAHLFPSAAEKLDPRGVVGAVLIVLGCGAPLQVTTFSERR